MLTFKLVAFQKMMASNGDTFQDSIVISDLIFEPDYQKIEKFCFQVDLFLLSLPFSNLFFKQRAMHG